MRIARTVVLAFFVVLCAVVAQAADFTINNDCNQSISAVLHLDDLSTVNVTVSANSEKIVAIGSHTVAAVTINNQTVVNGSSNRPVTLANSAVILVSVFGEGSVWVPVTLENGANSQIYY